MLMRLVVIMMIMTASEDQGTKKYLELLSDFGWYVQILVRMIYHDYNHDGDGP